MPYFNTSTGILRRLVKIKRRRDLTKEKKPIDERREYERKVLVIFVLAIIAIVTRVLF